MIQFFWAAECTYSCWTTLAGQPAAISQVRSVLNESQTMTSSAQVAVSMHSRMLCSSFFVGMMTVSFPGRADALRTPSHAGLKSGCRSCSLAVSPNRRSPFTS